MVCVYVCVQMCACVCVHVHTCVGKISNIFANPIHNVYSDDIIVILISNVRPFKYHIRTNIGEELNLADWQIAMQSPSLNLTNIFL